MVIKDLISQQTKRLDVSGIFIEIGMVPNSEPLKEIVKLNNFGEIPTDSSSRTGVAGLYAVGDVTDVPEKQIIITTGDGAKVALQAHRYLQHLTR